MDRKITAILMVMLSVVVAGAYATLLVSPLEQDVVIGDGPVTYTITLNTDETGTGYVNWATEDPSIIAAVGPVGGPFGTLEQVGTYSFTSPGGEQTFEMQVRAVEGAVNGEKYDIAVSYADGAPFNVKALATATADPVPELSTIVLTSAGLIGLLGLVMTRKKD